MATYKVIQDVEAEDKLFGPLTLRQFIYGAVAAICLFLSYSFATHSAGFLMVVTLPIAFVAGFFAFPWGRDQPTEIWALAKIRFLLKPRRRIWDQSGVKELVTITAPKRVETYRTNGLSETEVRSRLQALASTIDTRGWATKSVYINAYSQSANLNDSDRLVTPSLLPKPVDDVIVQAADDMLDEQNNAGAQRMQSMINQSTKAHRERLMASLQNSATSPAQTQTRPANYWFLNQPSPTASIPNDMAVFGSQVVTPGADTNAGGAAAGLPAQDEIGLVAELEEHKRQSATGAYYGHMHTIKPLSEQARPATPQPATPPSTVMPVESALTPPAQPNPAPVTPSKQAAILQLASNDDLNVATIAREAERSAPQNEVVIKLH
ncbi:MAG TPA: PrgI family protein [Candidatus Saccharimonadales bacterium]